VQPFELRANQSQRAPLLPFGLLFRDESAGARHPATLPASFASLPIARCSDPLVR
jgi:hypothetical protein